MKPSRRQRAETHWSAEGSVLGWSTVFLPRTLTGVCGDSCWWVVGLWVVQQFPPRGQVTAERDEERRCVKLLTSNGKVNFAEEVLALRVRWRFVA